MAKTRIKVAVFFEKKSKTTSVTSCSLSPCPENAICTDKPTNFENEKHVLKLSFWAISPLSLFCLETETNFIVLACFTKAETTHHTNFFFEMVILTKLLESIFMASCRLKG